MSEIVLIFPHQLYKKSPIDLESKIIFILEDPLLFGDKKYPLKFHKLKLVLHRASMKTYFEYLSSTFPKSKVIYVDYQELENYKEFFQELKSKFNPLKIHVVDPTDYILEKRINKIFADLGTDLIWYESPNFLTSKRDLNTLFGSATRKRYLHSKYYEWQRKRLNILIESDGRPTGGRWSFDIENRKRLPKGIQIPKVEAQVQSSYLKEAIEYVEKNFPNNYGEIGGQNFIYPINFQEAENLLDNFIQTKLKNFGPYEDSINQEPFLFHSLLSSSLNIGLLYPSEIVQKVLNHFESLTQDQQSEVLPSVEGYIRQIIGWREFMRAIYLREGVFQRNSNFLNHKNKLDQRWYKGETRIDPVDKVIKQLNKFAYSHHIERLMVMGNFMLLCEIEPSEVYNWFMEMYIDSYDWVMVPNVYGMSQYADGGLMVTKPYFSSSNYILKMSDYKKGEWSEIWDALFWRFVDKNRKVVLKNPRMGLIVNQFDKKSVEDKDSLLKKAENFIKNLN